MRTKSSKQPARTARKSLRARLARKGHGQHSVVALAAWSLLPGWAGTLAELVVSAEVVAR